jgi:hypothetical protein
MNMTVSARSFLERLLVASALLFLSACGYRLAGAGGLFPGDIETVYVEPFISRTRHVGIEQEITSALRSEFYRRGWSGWSTNPNRRMRS